MHAAHVIACRHQESTARRLEDRKRSAQAQVGVRGCSTCISSHSEGSTLLGSAALLGFSTRLPCVGGGGAAGSLAGMCPATHAVQQGVMPAAKQQALLTRCKRPIIPVAPQIQSAAWLPASHEQLRSKRADGWHPGGMFW